MRRWGVGLIVSCRDLLCVVRMGLARCGARLEENQSLSVALFVPPKLPSDPEEADHLYIIIIII